MLLYYTSKIRDNNIKKIIDDATNKYIENIKEKIKLKKMYNLNINYDNIIYNINNNENDDDENDDNENNDDKNNNKNNDENNGNIIITNSYNKIILFINFLIKIIFRRP